MGYYTILKNSSLEIQLEADYQDGGWSFINGVAIHDKCNSGYFRNFIFQPEVGSTYTVSFTVASLTEGSLKVYMGESEIIEITQNGTYNIDHTALTNVGVSFWADKDVIVSDFKVLEGSIDPVTILFDYDNKAFVGFASYDGEFATLFIDNMVSFENGRLWIHDRNNERNTYYGVLHPLKVSFYVNIDSQVDKDFFSIALDSSSGMLVEVEIDPKEGKLKGQRSRIKRGNFKLEKGLYKAAFMKDMNDPRFTDELQALLKGADLQGKIMKVTLTHMSKEEFQLSSVEVEVATK